MAQTTTPNPSNESHMFPDAAGKNDRILVLLLGLRDWNDVEVAVRGLPKGNQHGIEVAGAFRNLMELYEAAKEFEADVVLLDPFLPGFSDKGLGAEAITDLSHFEKKPIITVAAVPAGTQHGLTMEEMGARGHVTLPLDQGQVMRLVSLLPSLIKEAYLERASPTYIPKLSRETTRIIDHGGWQRRTIAVWSPKGGVGKTFLAANLACALGVIANRSTVLVDADMNQGNVHVQLNMGPEVEQKGQNIFGLATQYQASGKFTPDLLASRLVPYRGSLKVLAGIPVMTLGGEGALNGSQGENFMRELLQALEKISDFRVIDLGQSYHHAVHVTALEKSDLNLVVVNSEAASVHDVYKSLPPLRDILDLDPARFKLVFNKFSEAHGISRKEVVELLGLPQFGLIPMDSGEEVTISINRGVPLVLSGKRSPVVDSLVELTSSFYAPLRDIWQSGHRLARSTGILERMGKVLAR